MGRINVTSSIFEGPSGPNQILGMQQWSGNPATGPDSKRTVVISVSDDLSRAAAPGILAEGAIALSVTLSGGALFAS